MPAKGAGLPADEPGVAATEPDFVLELTEGRVVEAVEWPPAGLRPRTRVPVLPATIVPGPGAKGSWRLGRRPEGRVRARIEAPLDAGLVVRGGDHVVSVPLVAILERPQHTPPQSPLNVGIERLAWDSLAIDLGVGGGDGIVAPLAEVPVSVAFNILLPESTDVAVRTTAVVRSIYGGDVLWRYEPREVVPTNRREPPVRIWSLTAPRGEGTYVLEVRASWEPAGGRDGLRLGRLIRRRKPAAVTNSSVRRVVFTVIDPLARQAAIGRDGRETEVDAIDLARTRSHRPLAAGRSPTAEAGRFAWAVPPEALIEPSRRDRLRGWFIGVEAAKLNPASASGLAWSAVGLKVAHPDRPHRLTLKVKGGEPSALGVALIESGGGPGSPSRLVLDACASGPPILKDGPPAAFTWLVWPGSSEMVLVLVNRSPDAEVRPGTVTLTELDDAQVAPSPSEPQQGAVRTLGLYLSGPHALEPFGGDQGFLDTLTTARNLVRYLGYSGASAVVLSEDLADRARRRALDGQADEDSTGPDRLETIRRVLARQGYSLWLELGFDGPDSLPGLPPADSAEAVHRGLVRVDSQGRADGPAFHPLHPEVREAMKRRVVQALTRNQPGRGETGGGSRTGLLIRLGPGPTLLGTPDTGLDDATFERFVHETFSAETARAIPGLGNTDPDRFAARSRYLAGVGRMPWLTWRSRAIAALYAELAEVAATTVRGSVLAVVTPGLDGGPAGTEARRVDRAGLAPSQAWRSVGLDLQTWPSGPGAPLLLRGVSLSTDALAHDLATSPDLDALVAARSHRGLLLTIDGDPLVPGSAARAAAGEELPEAPSPAASLPASSSPSSADPNESGPSGRDAPARNTNPRAAGPRTLLTALPLGDGPAADEPLGHAMAALDVHWIFLAEEAVAGHEERLRRIAGVLRALPAWPAVPSGVQENPSPRPFGVAVRSIKDGAQTFLEIANDSPYPLRLAGVLDAPVSALVEDMGRGLRLSPVPEAGGRNLVLDLLPYGVAAIRVGAPRVQLSSVTPYPSEAVLASMQARFNELAAQLARLNHGLSAVAAEPANPGFEPDPDPDSSQRIGPVAQGAAPAPAAPASDTPPVPWGWRVEGNQAGTSKIAIDRENPHSGQGSLRLTAAVAPGSVVSETFVPNIQSSLMIQAFLRASSSGAKVRIWIEGESGGQPYVRRSELSVSTEWQARAVRASDIPAGGLSSARLRFELLTPGILWIDELHIPGETTLKSARLNAQHTLLAALQAYREQRFADFARLAGSHWIRESSTVATTRLARTIDQPPAGAARSTDAAGASALPSERKLR
ncbi:MAG: hypothetical protein ACHRXM_20235 [Isosphaerales bacterium]